MIPVSAPVPDYSDRGCRNHVAVLHAGGGQCACDHGTGYIGQIGDFHLDAPIGSGFYIRAAVGSGTDLFLRCDAFHIFALVCVGDFDGLHLIGGSPKILIHGRFLLLRQIRAQSYNIGAVSLYGKRKRCGTKRGSHNYRKCPFHFFHMHGVITRPPFP